MITALTFVHRGDGADVEMVKYAPGIVWGYKMVNVAQFVAIAHARGVKFFTEDELAKI